MSTSYWTPGRIALALAIVVIGAGVIGFVGAREIARFQESYAADAAYARLLERAAEEQSAGFNLDDLTVSSREITPGGPPKDGIPSLIDPETVAIDAADHLRDDDRVVGVSLGGQTRAYPVRALTYHEAINDEVGGVPILVVYCPLCDSVSVVDRRLEGGTYTFGVSGLLLNSNVLLHDRTDDALWSQLGFTAISGPHAGRSLTHLPWDLTTLTGWRRRHPDSTVMTFNTGYDRDYDQSPYGDYLASDRLIFPVSHKDMRLRAKTPVVGIKLGDYARAYPADAIRDAADGIVRDTMDGETIVLEAGPESVRVAEAPPAALIAHTFWYAWAAFHPGTEIYEQ
ncbi:MAG: DUF3179 domain-containing protein [Planctomycetota bacterium]|jgi:hypothetical protein